MIKEDAREKTPEEIAELESKKTIKIEGTNAENITKGTNPKFQFALSSEKMTIINKVGLALSSDIFNNNFSRSFNINS